MLLPKENKVHYLKKMSLAVIAKLIFISITFYANDSNFFLS